MSTEDLAHEAERITLGAMMLDARVIDDVTARLRSSDFADVRHGSIFAAIVATHASRGEPGPVPVALALRSVAELQRIGGAAYLHTLIAAVPTAANATWYAGVVAGASQARRAVEEAARYAQIARTGDLAQIEAEHARLIAAWTGRDTPAAGDLPAELDEFLGGEDPEYDWLVPGLIERGDRVILTGPEGGGKSTLLRQFALQCSAGIHPFGGDPMEPMSVLIVDLENSARQVRRALRPLRIAAGARYERKPGLHLRIRAGLDLLSDGDGRWLLDQVLAVQPDLVVTGPTYKMASGDPTEEKTARAVTAWLDRIRAEAGPAMLIEAHTPHGTNGGKRPTRPYGASLWLRWPEFGLYLSPEGHVEHWRGARDERDWPALLRRGGAWPWMPVDRERDRLWSRIEERTREGIDATGRRPSMRALATLTGASDTSVRRAISEHQAEWDALGQLSEGGAP